MPSPDSLPWNRAKDLILVALTGGVVTFLGLLWRGQTEMTKEMAEYRRDIAVLFSERNQDRRDIADLQQRVRELEKGRL